MTPEDLNAIRIVVREVVREELLKFEIARAQFRQYADIELPEEVVAQFHRPPSST